MTSFRTGLYCKSLQRRSVEFSRRNRRLRRHEDVGSNPGAHLRRSSTFARLFQSVKLHRKKIPRFKRESSSLLSLVSSAAAYDRGDTIFIQLGKVSFFETQSKAILHRFTQFEYRCQDSSE